MKYIYREKTMDDRESLVRKLLEKEKGKGILFFEGPSGSGKSLLLADMLKTNNNSKRFSNEEFREMIIGMMRRAQTYNLAIEAIIKQLMEFRIIGVEDVDFQAGQPSTLKCIAEIVNELSKEKLIIFAGINMKTRIPELLDKVRVLEFIYFDNNK